MDTIGQKIYNLRKVKGISQEELADKVGVSRQTIYKWESDSAQPNSANIKCLCEIFSVDANYFYNIDNVSPSIKANNEIAVSSINNKCIKKLVIGLACSALLTIVFGFISIWFGFSVFSTNTGDVVGKTINLTLPAFISMLILFVVAFLLTITFIILIFKSRKSNVN